MGSFSNIFESQHFSKKMSNITKAGWCVKEGGRIKTKKKRWFVLDGNILHYYEKEGGKEKGSIEIFKDTVVENDTHYKIQPCFTVKAKNQRVYRIFPNSNDERDDWILAIRKVFDHTTNSDTDSFNSDGDCEHPCPLSRSEMRRLRFEQRRSSHL